MACCGPRPCPFCGASRENGFRIVHEDEDLVAFHDRSPSAEVHLLVIPKRHVGTVDTLTAADLPLLDAMRALALRLVPLFSPPPSPTSPLASAPDFRLGFHVPPFNSVAHLHMHVLVGKMRFGRAWRYRWRVNWRTAEEARADAAARPG